MGRLNPAAYSNKLIATVHIAKNQLGMDDDSYRALLQHTTGKNSCSKMSLAELGQVIAAMKQKGFAVKSNKSHGKPHNFESQAMPLMITRIEQLLAAQGLSWAYADAIAQQMFGIQKCAWLRQEKQLKAIIAALYNKQRRG